MVGQIPGSPLAATQFFHGHQARGGAGLHAENPEDLEHMLLHRTLADVEEGGNAAIGLSLRQPQQGFRDTWCETEGFLQGIDDDELVEATPLNTRLRKCA